MGKTLYALGNLTIDDIVIYDTQQIFLSNCGGNALFAAIGARIWHNAVGIIARAGRSYPETNIRQINKAGVKTHLTYVPFNDIHDWALYEAGGARQFVNHLSSGSHYEMSITGDEIPEPCLDAAGFHIAPMPTDIQATIVERVTSRNCVIALDPHVEYLSRPNFNQLAYDLLPKITMFLPSREEATALYGKDDPQAAARAFAEAGACIVAIKLSTEGSLVYMPAHQRMIHVPIFEVDTVDPTGAGMPTVVAFWQATC